MAKAKTRWIRTETSRDHDAWELREGDEVLADLDPDRPTRWHGNGVSGSVVDMDAPVHWSCTLWDANNDHTQHRLISGLTVAEAKAEAVALIKATTAAQPK